MKRVLEGPLVDSQVGKIADLKRRQIVFDELTGLIQEIKEPTLPRDKVDYYFADHEWVFPGMGDIHIHAREDASGKHLYKEDFASASQAALQGGVVHVADMPNNPIPPQDKESYLQKLKLTKSAHIPVLPYGAITPESKKIPYKIPYKVYLGPSIGENHFSSNEELERVLSQYPGEWVSFHCEDPDILEKHKHEANHGERRPPEAEVLATELALHLIEKFSLKGKLCHYSAGEGLKRIREARKKGIFVQLEVTPQHLYFSEDLLPEDPQEKNLFQMNPPIRPEDDRLKMLEAVKKGEIDFLATDHAPHSPEEKMKGTSGLPGLDTFGGFVTWLLLEQKVSPGIVAKMCSENPGHFFNRFLPSLRDLAPWAKRLGEGLGLFRENYSATFTVLDLTTPYTVTKEKLYTKAKWSPFLGKTFPGSVKTVILKGQKL